jgi:hypothetical protein
MKLIYILSIIVVSSFSIHAQNLTGVWRGTFEQSTLDPLFGKFSHETYKYEVQLNNKYKGALEGVTYSYLTTVFYGKANLKGIFDKKNKTLTIKETVLIEEKSVGRSEPCLMTCYLDYSKNGNTETLIGTYSSINMNKKTDCGNGTVYLERVAESDFEKEDFLKKLVKTNKSNTPRKLPSGKNFDADRKEALAKINAVKKTIMVKKEAVDKTVFKPNTNKAIAKLTPPQKTAPIKKSTDLNPVRKLQNRTTKKQVIRSSKEPHIVTKQDTQNADSIVNTMVETPKEIVPEVKIVSEPVIDVLINRENKLTAKLVVDVQEVNIEFYDNGEIDNDTISVYKDNKPAILNGRLSTNPIILNLKFDAVNTFYEIICVAENLGDIPPNTALMVINYGRKREEVFLTSDERKNAKVIIEYKGK